jgi:S-adenosylmethionine hydrolase
MTYDWVSFTTDYGTADGFVAACKGVLGVHAPAVRVIDVTHQVPPQDVRRGAAVLAQTVPWLPPAVHLAVVDPGVGGQRRPLALRDESGRLYVGPDNGLLLPATERYGGVVAAHELANPAYALEQVSRTFHGRDLFSPAAAHLALGVPLGELGPPIDPDALVRLDVPQPQHGAHGIRATVLGIDRFGNAALNLTRDDFERSGIVPGTKVEVDAGGNRYFAVAARTFADAREGDLILYEDSYRNVAIAVSRGSAAALLGLDDGSELGLHVDAP